MTTPLDDTQHYIGVLEAVVAVLAVKSGLNPETLMGNAIRDLTHQANMDTAATDQLIASRWTGRDLKAGTLAAQNASVGTPVPAQQAEQVATSDPFDMQARLAARKARLQASSEETPNP